MRCAPALLLAATVLSGCGWLYNPWGAYPPRNVTAQDSGKEVGLSHGQQLFVRLPLKEEEGFEWVIREPEVTAVKAEGAPAVDKEAGLQTWTFTPVRDGQQTLRLEYRRVNDYLTAPAEIVSYNVTVD
jgi:predicted secreted protein